MFFSKSIALLAPLSLAAATNTVEVRDDCKDVHLFLARGNGEAYPGRVGALGDSVCNGLSSCDYENIMFVSTNSYCTQAQDGATAGQAQINAYAAKCPNSKLVLGGYSLGAHIVGDILGGGGGSFYDCSENTIPPMSATSGAGAKIAAALLFGDVRHVANQGYNVGTGSGSDGQYPRTGSQLSNLNAFGGKMRSYCLSTDPICALGNDGLSHETYMDVYASAAGEYVHQILNVQATPTSTSPAASSSASSSSAARTTSAIILLSKSSSTGSSASASSSGSSSAASSGSVSSSVSSGASASATSSGSVSSSSGSASVSGSASPTATSSSDLSDISASSSGAVADGLSSSATSDSSSPTTTGTVNPSTFAPFVFSTATGSDTSSTTTIAPVAASAAAPFSQTATAVATTVNGLVTSVISSKKVVSTATPTVIGTSSRAGAGSNAGISMTLLTLVVVKVLAF